MLTNHLKYAFTRVLQRLDLSDLSLKVGRSSHAIIPNPPLVMKTFTDPKAQAEFLADPSLQAVLERAREAKIFWDVGANMGLFSILARDVNPELEVVSVEASTEFYQVLCRNWLLNPRGWTCLHIAVGDREGLVEMSRGLGGCEHVLPANQPADHKGARESRPMMTLDQLAKLMGHDRIDLLKIDVEGLELAVLRGASGLLDAGKIGAIVLEADEHDLRYGTNNSELVAFLASKDYQLDALASVQGRSANNCQVFAPGTSKSRLAGA
jgi:FkbM family methyltransferase